MTKISFVLKYENKLMKEFNSVYMPLSEHKPLEDVMQMFLDDEEYSVITNNPEEMKRKLISWANLYYQNHEQKPANYIELKNRMKQFLREYGYSNDNAIGVFVSELITNGIKEEDAYKIANSIRKEIIEGMQR